MRHAFVTCKLSVMRLIADTIELSATDVSNFLGCRHRTGLDLAVALGAPQPHRHDPLVEALRARGEEHERRYVDSLVAQGLDVLDLRGVDDRPARTVSAIRGGVPVILQADLRANGWQGSPDVLRRIERPSPLGAWSYEVARHQARARDARRHDPAALRLLRAARQTSRASTPEHFHVVTPDAATPRADVSRRRLRGVLPAGATAMLVDAVAPAHERSRRRTIPSRSSTATSAAGGGAATSDAGSDDHLSFVAGISRAAARRSSTRRAVTTLDALGGVADADAVQAAPRSRRDLRAGARAGAPAVSSARRGQRRCSSCSPIEPEQGSAQTAGAVAGRSVSRSRRRSVRARRQAASTCSASADRPSGSSVSRAGGRSPMREERARVRGGRCDLIVEALRRRIPDMHVYHYAPYEPSAFKRLMGRYATREARARSRCCAPGASSICTPSSARALRAGVESYSIKKLEPFYGFAREVRARATRARRLRRVGARARGARVPMRDPGEVRATVEGYNRDDCRLDARGCATGSRRLRASRSSGRHRDAASAAEPPDEPATSRRARGSASRTLRDATARRRPRRCAATLARRAARALAARLSARLASPRGQGRVVGVLPPARSAGRGSARRAAGDRGAGVRRPSGTSSARETGRPTGYGDRPLLAIPRRRWRFATDDELKLKDETAFGEVVARRSQRADDRRRKRARRSPALHPSAVFVHERLLDRHACRGVAAPGETRWRRDATGAPRARLDLLVPPAAAR